MNRSCDLGAWLKPRVVLVEEAMYNLRDLSVRCPPTAAGKEVEEDPPTTTVSYASSSERLIEIVRSLLAVVLVQQLLFCNVLQIPVLAFIFTVLLNRSL
jgi:hypothetical protein